MKRTPGVAIASVICLGIAACGGARPRGGSSDLESIRADTAEVWVTDSRGDPLPVFYVDGRHYLLGRIGTAYEIWIYNPGETRIEAVVSVDGRDVISGRRADYRSDRGYVVDPGEELRIPGFRTSLDEVAEFEFSRPGDSYASRIGGGADVGVIGVAVFEEDVSAPPPPMPIAAEERESAERRRPAAAGADAAPASSKAAPLEMRDEASREPGLGTRWGREIRSDAEKVPFRRRDELDPAEVISLFYDDAEGLERRGVELPGDDRGPLETDHEPDPFPGAAREPDAR
jgi:hypothetical protein